MDFVADLGLGAGTALIILAAGLSMLMCFGDSWRRPSIDRKDVTMRWNSMVAIELSRASIVNASESDFWLSLTSLLSWSRSMDCHNIEKPAISKSSFRCSGKV